MMFSLWSSLNHVPIKYWGLIKKMRHLRPIYFNDGIGPLKFQTYESTCNLNAVTYVHQELLHSLDRKPLCVCVCGGSPPSLVTCDCRKNYMFVDFKTNTYRSSQLCLLLSVKWFIKFENMVQCLLNITCVSTNLNCFLNIGLDWTFMFWLVSGLMVMWCLKEIYWTTFPNFINYSTFNHEHTWENLSIHLRNQHTCALDCHH